MLIKKSDKINNNYIEIKDDDEINIKTNCDLSKNQKIKQLNSNTNADNEIDID